MDEEFQVEDSINHRETEIRERQSRCIHPSYKCSCCGLYRDNLVNEYKEAIRHLLESNAALREAKEVKYIIYFTSF